MPSGLVRISRSPARSPPLRISRPGRRPPGHRKTERQLGPLGAVAADQYCAGRLQHLGAALQHVEQVVLAIGGRAGGKAAIASAVSGMPPIA